MPQDADTSLDAIRKSNVNFYSQAYPRIEAIDKYLENVGRMRSVLSYRISVPAGWAKPAPMTATASPTPASAKVADPVKATTSSSSGVKVWATVACLILAVAVFVAGIIWWGAKDGKDGPPEVITADLPTLHRCVVCGQTERSDPSLEFRVAGDGADYCHRHLPKRFPPPLPPNGGWSSGDSKL